MEHDHESPAAQDLMPIARAVQQVRQRYPTVSQSSLRFFEREGLVKPTRTPGGHRLYSPEDIQRIVQIKAWQDDRLSLEEIRSRLEQRDRLPDPAVLSSEFIRLILNRRAPEARSLILHADAIGMPLVTTFGEVLQPSLFVVGSGWEEGHILVAQEKEASELVRDLIAELTQRHDDGASNGPTIVAGCVEGERHELGIRMITGVMRSRGCLIHYLGADVAHEFFEEAMRLHQPDAVLLSVKLKANVDHAGEAAERMRAVHRLGDALPVLAGGDAVYEAPERFRDVNVMPMTDVNLASMIETIMATLPEPTSRQEAG